LHTFDEYSYQQSSNNQESEDQDIIHGAGGDDEIFGGDEVTIEEMTQTLQSVIDAVRAE